MAVRWGASENTLLACNMDFLTLDTLDEGAGLNSGDTLEALESCLDSSILSFFEDVPTIETKGLDEESEATLLTALTEILDNVDDENLSPFDTLPDSDLLSGQKGREHSPLRRLLCMSRSPPEKDALRSVRPLLAGKSLPRIHPDSQQRSDGEEEEDGSLTLSPGRLDSPPDNELLDWEGLPITFEQEGENNVSVSLGELVRHMHPYCMAICVEDDKGEQILPEGGILLEVVDQGENGEPILAIPDMNLPAPLQQPSENEQKCSDVAEEVFSDSSEHIVVDDEDVTVSEAPVKVATSRLCLEVKDEMSVKRQKEEIKEKSPCRRKKKKKDKKKVQHEAVEGRVLRSASVKKAPQELLKKAEKRSYNMKQNHISVTPAATVTPTSSRKPKKLSLHQTESQMETTTTAVLPATSAPSSQDKVLSNAGVEISESSSPPVLSSVNPIELKQPVPGVEKLEDSSPAPSAVLSATQADHMSSDGSTAAPSPASAISDPTPPPAPAVPEPKPKSLSLAEYRRLRQQKKPAPVEKRENYSTKWPSLPELPKELTPIPCLPDPSPRDPRQPHRQSAKTEVEEVKAAWQPRGPCAPPTPEALLVPPAYMVASSNKASAPKPQQTPEPQTVSTPKPSQSQNPSVAAAVPSSVKKPPTERATAQPVLPSVPQSSSLPSALKPSQPVQLSKERSPAPLGDKGRVSNGPDNQPVSLKSVELHCAETTTDRTKPDAAAVSAPSAPLKTTTIPNVPEVTGSASLNSLSISCRKSSKSADSRSLPSSSPSSPFLETQSLRAKPTLTAKPTRAKSHTQELIEAFTSEIGIEAADLTSLLEQFEETQAKEEHCIPEVSGRAAAVGNSSNELAPEKTVVERVRATDLSSTAALTPPATPPHQMWKPLTPLALLGKSKAAEASKSNPSKVIQIEARPLPSSKTRSKPTPAAPTIDPDLACLDHDYCLPSKTTSSGEPGKRWNVKQQSFIVIKPIKQTTTQEEASSVRSTKNLTDTDRTEQVPLREPLNESTTEMEKSSVLETPDASPSRQDIDTSLGQGSPKRGPYGRSYRHRAASRTPSPESSPKEWSGGRSRKRRSRRSPSPMSSASEMDSHSSRSRSRSRSRSPSKKRYRRHHSGSSSRSSSRSSSPSSPSESCSPPRRRRYSYSSSRSGSWSRSRSRSQSPHNRAQWNRNRRLYSSSCRPVYGQCENMTVDMKRRKEKAIEERRVVYVGRIRSTMTQKELKERFSFFGEIEDCTLHFRDHGDNYGFVTYYNTNDAFMAIENGSKLRKSDELPFDLCFGGRRQFCKTTYADLDSSREYDPLPTRAKYDALDFDTLLKQAQQNLKR